MSSQKGPPPITTPFVYTPTTRQLYQDRGFIKNPRPTYEGPLKRGDRVMLQTGTGSRLDCLMGTLAGSPYGRDGVCWGRFVSEAFVDVLGNPAIVDCDVSMNLLT